MQTDTPGTKGMNKKTCASPSAHRECEHTDNISKPTILNCNVKDNSYFICPYSSWKKVVLPPLLQEAIDRVPKL